MREGRDVKPNRRARILFSVIAAAVSLSIALGIFLLSSQNTESTISLTLHFQSIADSIAPGVDFKILRQLAHVLEFGVLGIAVYFLAVSVSDRSWRGIVLSAYVCFSWSVVDQVHKLFTDGREFEPQDLLLDAIGYAGAIFLSHLFHRLLNGKGHGGGRGKRGGVYWARTLLSELISFLVIPALFLSFFAGGYRLWSRWQQHTIDVREESRQERNHRIRSMYPEADAYQLLKMGVDLHVLVAGDTIGAASNANDALVAWYDLLNDYCQDRYGARLTINNLSLDGNNSYSGYAQVEALKDADSYDLAILCFGLNEDETDFPLFYECLIRSVLRNCPSCSVIAVQEYLDGDHSGMRDYIERLCNYYAIQRADVNYAFLRRGDAASLLSEGGSIPNEAGYQVFAGEIERVIGKSIKDEVSRPVLQVKPLLDTALEFSEADGYSAEIFQRVDDRTVKAALGHIHGAVGLDLSYEPGENRITVYGDGKVYAVFSSLFDTTFSQRHVFLLSKNVIDCAELVIQFTSPTQADSFQGITVSHP